MNVTIRQTKVEVMTRKELQKDTRFIRSVLPIRLDLEPTADYRMI